MRLYFAIAGFALMAFMAKAEVPSGVVEKMLALEAEAIKAFLRRNLFQLFNFFNCILPIALCISVSL